VANDGVGRARGDRRFGKVGNSRGAGAGFTELKSGSGFMAKTSRGVYSGSERREREIRGPNHGRHGSGNDIRTGAMQLSGGMRSRVTTGAEFREKNTKVVPKRDLPLTGFEFEVKPPTGPAIKSGVGIGRGRGRGRVSTSTPFLHSGRSMPRPPRV
jgi:hypothetical protein